MENIDLDIFKANFKREFDKFTYEDWKNRDKGTMMPFHSLVNSSFRMISEHKELREGWDYVELWVMHKILMWKSLEIGN